MFALLFLLGTASAGSILWDGRLNIYTSAAFLDDWSWSNQIGPYQYYIHGDGARSEYVALSTGYKNSADSGSDQGIQITIDNSSSWNGQTMMRTELIPQTSAAINAGKVFYHFSMQHTATNPPSQTEEHQVCFFESHFTEMKYGLISGASGTSSNQLQWYANSESQWNVTFEASVWHNIAYGIDFDAQTVTFYHSTGAKDLALTAGPVSASTSSNGADWHLGVLRLASTTGSTDSATEDWHFSGVYIENGDLTKSVSGPGEAASSETSSSSSTAAASRVATSSTSTPTTLQTKVEANTSSTTTIPPATSMNTTTCTSSTTAAMASNPAPVFSYSTTPTISTPTSTSLVATTALTSAEIAENPAQTFSPTGSVSLNSVPSDASRWYPQTSSSASETECEVVYATVTVTA